jgi:hypothetical protein
MISTGPSHSRATRDLSFTIPLDLRRATEESLAVYKKNAIWNEVDDQLHAIWSVSLSRRTFWLLIVSSGVKGFVLF